MTAKLLTPEFLKQLDRLELQTRRVLGGQIKGERRSRKKGISIDFADYRQYTRGDDLRFIDWNIYGRLDRLFIKLFYEEQDLQCNILLDTSRSMDFGTPNKLELAKKFAAAVAYVGLSNHDKIGISCFQGKTAASFRPTRGQHQIRRMLAFLDGIKADGQTSLASACRDFTLKPGVRGIVLLITDFLDPAGYQSALRYLMRDGLDVQVIHVLSPQEIEPEIGGHVELHDIETDHKVELTVNARMKDAYMRNVQAFCTQIQDHCVHYGMGYMLVRSDAPIEELIIKRLREAGVVKA